MGMHSTTQAFQFDVPFRAAVPARHPGRAVRSEATVTFADPNRQVVTFDTPMSMSVLGREHRRRFYSLRGQHRR